MILVLLSPVSSPRRFRAKVLSPSQLQVSWKEPKGEFDGYSVIYAAAPGKSTSFLLSLVGGDVCPEELKNGSEDVIESGWRAGWRWLGSEAAGVLSSSLELLSQTCLHTCSISNREPGSSSDQDGFMFLTEDHVRVEKQNLDVSTTLAHSCLKLPPESAFFLEASPPSSYCLWA